MYNSMWFLKSWLIFFPERNHENRMSKALKKHDELEEKLKAMQKNYGESLGTTMNMKQAFDDRLQVVRKSYCFSGFC